MVLERLDDLEPGKGAGEDGFGRGDGLLLLALAENGHLERRLLLAVSAVVLFVASSRDSLRLCLGSDRSPSMMAVAKRTLVLARASLWNWFDDSGSDMVS